jgi:acetyl-CoA carboxylase biotin carboxyl carrier protein
MSPARKKKAPAARVVAPKAPKAPSVSRPAKVVLANPTAVQNLGLEELKSLIALVAKESIHEFEFETASVRFRIRKDSGGTAPVAPSPAGHVVTQMAAVPSQTFLTPAAPTSAPAPVETEDANLQYITSPIVGTFYRSPSPTAPSFVQPGDFVKPGQTLCIVEAMKLMNEIESEVAGEVVKVLVENGQPVEYGERIFAIRVN